MKRIILGSVVAVTAIVAVVMIYEDVTLDRGICGGGARYSFTLVVGDSPGLRYGIERESYWTDQAGELIIPYMDPSSLAPGSKHHIHTNVLFRDLSFSLPLRPWAIGLVAVLVVSAVRYFVSAKRVRPEIHGTSISS